MIKLTTILQEITIKDFNTPQNWTIISNGDEYTEAGTILMNEEKVERALKSYAPEEDISDYMTDIYEGGDPEAYQKMSLKELIEDFKAWKNPYTPDEYK